jgi:hypothetical protein
MPKKFGLFLILVLALFLFSKKNALAYVACSAGSNNDLQIYEYETWTPGFAVNSDVRDHRISVEFGDNSPYDVLNEDRNNVAFQVGTGPWETAGFKSGNSYRLDTWVTPAKIADNCSAVRVSVRWTDNDSNINYCQETDTVYAVRVPSVVNPSLADLIAGVTINNSDPYGILSRSWPYRHVFIKAKSGYTLDACGSYFIDFSNYLLAFTAGDSGECKMENNQIIYKKGSPYTLRLLGSNLDEIELVPDKDYNLIFETYYAPVPGASEICGPVYGNVTTVFGYVRDEDTGTGIPGATINITYREDGSYYGSPIITTDDSGYWSIIINNNDLEQVRVEETNCPNCASDGSLPTILPGGMTISLNDVNEVWIEGPPNNIGPITFNDDDCDLTGPTPTPTPAPDCPLEQEQTDVRWQGVPLVNNYNATSGVEHQYGSFTASQTGYIDRVDIWGRLDRNVAQGDKVLTCKITDSSGGTDLGTSDDNDGPFSLTLGDWFIVNFTNTVNIVSGTDYRIYCKVNNAAGGGYIYWRRGPALDEKAHRIYICDVPLEPWWRVSLGNVHCDDDSLTLENAISSNVPSGRAILTNGGTFTWDSGSDTLDHGEATFPRAGQEQIAAQTGSYDGLLYNYNYFSQQLQDYAQNWAGGAPSEDGIYSTGVSGTSIGGAGWSLISNEIVILVNGNINITGEITVAATGALVIIASGDINISSSVPRVQGIYIAENINTGAGSDALTIAGGLIGWNSVNLQRDLGAGNTSQAELFIARYNMVNILKNSEALRALRDYKYTWQEVAP